DHQEIEVSSTAVAGGTQQWQAPEILLSTSDAFEGGGTPGDDNGFGGNNWPRDEDSSKEGDMYALGM
ncbi:hypothetical protein FRC11_012844, partial [Ceratobasidium sp. 423]